MYHYFQVLKCCYFQEKVVMILMDLDHSWDVPGITGQACGACLSNWWGRGHPMGTNRVTNPVTPQTENGIALQRPRHPVIPPEVWCFRYILGIHILFLAGVWMSRIR